VTCQERTHNEAPTENQWGEGGGLTWALVIVIACSLASGPAAWAQNETGISGNPCNPLEGPCGDTTDPPDPLAALNAAADALDAMQDDLMDNWYVGGLCGVVEQAEPVVTGSGDDELASAGFLAYQLADGSVLGSGTTDVAVTLGQPDVDVTIVMRDGDPTANPPVGANRQWTLTMTVTVSQGAVSMWGTLDYLRSTPSESASYVGGWIYSPEGGPMEDPASDAGFHAEVANMFGCQETVASANLLGAIFAIMVNGVNIGIHYIIDIFNPYTAPTPDSCLGPRLPSDTSACPTGAIDCADQLAGMCERVGDIPNVSNAFKKCMKGRCACGGSSFARMRIQCDDTSSCGACGGGAGACNLGGSTLKYCVDSTYDCSCIQTIFHEMSHSCGKMHTPEYFQQGGCVPGDPACEIGDWFFQGCRDGASVEPPDDPGAEAAQ